MSTQSTIYVPDDFYCPISGGLMVDPYTDPEGNTYEKAEIMRWLQMKPESPMTRSPLVATDLKENIAVRKSIESIKDKLTEEQLKVQSRISEAELQEFTSALEDIEVHTFYNDGKLLVKVKMPEVHVRQPVDIALCIDVSGSMGTEATLKGSAGETIRNGISVLSLTIAAAKTILSTLNEFDKISIISYTHMAKVIVSDMECSVANKESISIQLDQLRPLSTTNIWAGIHQSMETLRTTSPECRQKAIFLLTDGVPNDIPPRGHEYMITRYQETNKFRCPITCYGFGYTLDSPLLDSISKITGGDGYSFIPDASLLGNVFIHGISNFLITATSNAELLVSLKRDVKFSDGTTNKVVSLNSLKYGQDKNLLFDIEGDDDRDDFAEVCLTFGSTIIKSGEITLPDINFYNEQLYRHKGVQIIKECMELQKYNYADQVQKKITPFIAEMRSNLSLKASQFIQDMAIDFEGQVREALNMTRPGHQEDWFNKWGKHYLLSLMGAYESEICNNFKDKGIAHFGGSLFQSIRDEVSEIFDSLPPPKQDVRQTTYRGGGGRAQAPVDMSSYNNMGGACCAPESLILMDNHTYKQAQDVLKGDKVITLDESFNQVVSEIECVVRSPCPDNEALLVTLDGGLRITPWHPVIDKTRGSWDFPMDILLYCGMEECSDIYSFVIKNRKSLLVNDYIYSTLGHGIEGDVIQHDYYGTDKVINDMKALPNYEKGEVVLSYDMFKRSPHDGKVCNIVQGVEFFANL